MRCRILALTALALGTALTSVVATSPTAAAPPTVSRDLPDPRSCGSKADGCGAPRPRATSRSRTCRTPRRPSVSGGSRRPRRPTPGTGCATPPRPRPDARRLVEDEDGVEIVVGDEDCLHLDVTVPQGSHGSHRGGARPVLVWVHGGNFVDGAADDYGARPTGGRGRPRRRHRRLPGRRARVPFVAGARRPAGTRRATTGSRTRRRRCAGCGATSPRSVAIPQRDARRPIGGLACGLRPPRRARERGPVRQGHPAERRVCQRGQVQGSRRRTRPPGRCRVGLRRRGRRRRVPAAPRRSRSW